jgi:hypothetical protein
LEFHGNTKWLVGDLIILAVLWVWSDHTSLVAAFAEAQHWSLKMLGRAAVKSYQGLTGALVTVTARLLPLLWERLQSLMEQHAGRALARGGWLPLAVDGSRISTPHGRQRTRILCSGWTRLGNTAGRNAGSSGRPAANARLNRSSRKSG